MKKTSMLVAVILACALAAPVASGQDKSMPPKSATGMDMDRQMSRMQENMTEMQQQMERIRATTDPKERQQLMQKHMQTMRKNMDMMPGMDTHASTDSGRHGGMAMGDAKGAAGGTMIQRQEMMETRMDMMRMMMAQMMQHDQMMESMHAK